MTGRSHGKTIDAPFLYIFECEGFVKFGITRDPYQRLKVAQTNCPFEVGLVAVMEGGLREEAIIHSHFKRWKHRNEWFRREDDVARFCDAVAAETWANSSGMERRCRRAADEWFLANSLTADLRAPHPNSKAAKAQQKALEDI